MVLLCYRVWNNKEKKGIKYTSTTGIRFELFIAIMIVKKVNIQLLC